MGSSRRQPSASSARDKRRSRNPNDYLYDHHHYHHQHNPLHHRDDSYSDLLEKSPLHSPAASPVRSPRTTYRRGISDHDELDDDYQHYYSKRPTYDDHTLSTASLAELDGRNVQPPTTTRQGRRHGHSTRVHKRQPARQPVNRHRAQRCAENAYNEKISRYVVPHSAGGFPTKSLDPIARKKRRKRWLSEYL